VRDEKIYWAFILIKINCEFICKGFFVGSDLFACDPLLFDMVLCIMFILSPLVAWSVVRKRYLLTCESFTFRIFVLIFFFFSIQNSLSLTHF